jgi:hypothetical protein
VREQVLESDAVEIPVEDETDEPEGARPLPATVADGTDLAPWSGEMRTAALAAAGGLVAGAATVAVVRATRAVAPRKRSRRRLRGRERPQQVIASRSFLVDVHLLGQK